MENKKIMKKDMKLSDYVIEYLHSRGTAHIFGMSGGAAVHLFDSAAKNLGVGTTFVAHEQSAAMAADGYYRCLLLLLRFGTRTDADRTSGHPPTQRRA